MFRTLLGMYFTPDLILLFRRGMRKIEIFSNVKALAFWECNWGGFSS